MTLFCFKGLLKRHLDLSKPVNQQCNIGHRTGVVPIPHTMPALRTPRHTYPGMVAMLRGSTSGKSERVFPVRFCKACSRSDWLLLTDDVYETRRSRSMC